MARLTFTPNTTGAGSIWYNCNLERMQYSYNTLNSGTWSVGGALPVSPYYNIGSAGIQNAALSFGGDSGYSTYSYEYNGSSWSSGGSLSNNRYNCTLGAGTQNSALAFGGSSYCTEEYNGTSWSAGGAQNQVKNNGMGLGLQDAALGVEVFSSEEYDGTTWSYSNALINGRELGTGFGEQNAGLVVGGCFSSSFCPCTEAYNGTSWSTESQYIAGGTNGAIRMAGGGVQNDGYTFGGFDYTSTILSSTFLYDGTGWSAGGTMNTARCSLSGIGGVKCGLAIGGSPTADTEEFTRTVTGIGICTL